MKSLTALLLTLLFQDPVIRVPVRLVTTPVTVLDREGRFINGLTAKDFRLFDNEKPQVVRTDITAQPISLVIAVQTNQIMGPLLPKLRSLAPIFETLVLGESGETAVTGFNRQVRLLQDWTKDPGALRNTLTSLAATQDRSRMIDATLDGIQLLKSRPLDHRRVLLVIGDGHDAGSEAPLREAISEAQLHQVSIYSFSVSPWESAVVAGLPVQLTPRQEGSFEIDLKAIGKGIYRGARALSSKTPLALLTASTGGRQFPFLRQRALENAATRLGEELHSQYLLTYTPDNLDQTGFHQIRIEVKGREDLQVHARPGYWTSSI